MSKRKGIALAIVSGRGQTPVMMIPMIGMQAWPMNINFSIAVLQGSDVDNGRIMAVEKFRELGFKYIWFIDDDTVPPTSAGKQLYMLLEKHGPPHGDVMAASAVYTSRSSPPEPMVFAAQGAGPDYDWKVGDTFRRWGGGTGCMMINLDVFDKLPAPWFKTVSETNAKWSDDLYFCELLSQAGFGFMIHGGVLCHHYDREQGMIFELPRNSQPMRDRIAEPWEPDLGIVPAAKIPLDLVHNPWMTAYETAWLITRALKSEVFVEVGCWRGVTTRNIAKNSKAHIIAIDTFKGSREHLDPNSPHYEPRLKDPAWLYGEAVKNCAGLDVEFIEAKSFEAPANLDGNNGKIDTVFIDGSHEYKDVKRDILAWLSVVKPGGTLCGHDYNWPDVQRAVDELLPGAIAVPAGAIWTYTKPYAEG